ncbi:MAG: hypothetical protein V1833_01380 [Elusimicrobiota bacterium]
MKPYSKKLNYLVAVCLLLNSSCATGLLKVKYLENDDYSSLQDISYTPTDINNTTNKIQTLRERIQRYDDKLTDKDYDDIIKELTPIVEEYKKHSAAVNVINKDNGTIVIPPKTKLTLKLNTYCLSSQKASPSDDEPYILTNRVPDIPLYSEIMRYTNTKEAVDQHLKQNVIWNLQNKVKFEDLPSDQRELLLKVDKNAYLKVNNYFKEVAKEGLGKLIGKYLPSEVESVKEVVEIIKGKVYDYHEYAKRIENLNSKYKKPNNDKPVKAEGYEIYALVKANGYSNATVTFVNTTDNPIEINSYFEPLRKDVQSLGFDVPDFNKYYNNLQYEFTYLLGDILSLIGYGGLGDAKTLVENVKNIDRIYDIITACKNKTNAFNRTYKEFGYSKDDDTSNAFLHAYWNAIMTRDVGYDFAKEIADNHELNREPDNEASIEMDLWNNSIGRDICSRLKYQGIIDDDLYAKEILDNMDKLIQKPKKQK